VERLLHELLTNSCNSYPHKTALRFKDGTLSYQDLDRESNHIASLLRDNGVVTGDRVGIYMDKSLDAIISIFGVLKTGCCYVPLDPLAPRARLSKIADDCCLEYLITSFSKLHLVRELAVQTKALKHTIVLDAYQQEALPDIPGVQMHFRDERVKHQPHQIKVDIQPAATDLAYILYTSGSTGQPKGVMISHRAAYAFVDWSLQAFEICNDDIFSSHAPLHFDLSIFDIFVSIAAGATLCLIPQGWSSFPTTIVNFIRQNKISIWYSVPSALVQLVMHGKLDQQELPDLKRILFAGEVFPSKYLRQLMALLPTVDYFNLYGPTETNVITYYCVQKLPDLDMDIPIGSLCNGVKAYIVSESGSLVTRGEIGELHVESPTLMDGYWRDEQKTEDVLLKNPCHSEQGLVYKTGDLVHWNKEGLLVYHGRCDSMIKSRGYRIELGEIETVLLAHEKIKEVVVTAIPSEEFGTIIKAFLVTKFDVDLNETAIRRFCAETLPAYMVPESIHIVQALPRTSTGKIDRKAISDSGI